MLKHKAFKFRIYPTTEQAILINKTLGSARFVFNYFLNLKINEYKATGKAPNYNACSKLLTALKNANPWLKEPDKFSLQNSLKNLENSYKMFLTMVLDFLNLKLKETINKAIQLTSPTIILKLITIILNFLKSARLNIKAIRTIILVSLKSSKLLLVKIT